MGRSWNGVGVLGGWGEGRSVRGGGRLGKARREGGQAAMGEWVLGMGLGGT